ncbi:hypothetical protein [Nocardia ignorata]|uniref:hypothetical protein n=1 Tax=Nocardia ignorata TaxID=145285 RepID=UPI0008301544|nr:hypothetical protein [Nocardia ignorata]
MFDSAVTALVVLAVLFTANPISGRIFGDRLGGSRSPRPGRDPAAVDRRWARRTALVVGAVLAALVCVGYYTFGRKTVAHTH